MQHTSKIYVAGHLGLVGSTLLQALKNNNYENLLTKSFAELDLRNQKAVDEFFQKEQPEYVFLAAAKVGGIHANNIYKAEFIYDNLMIATNIIHAAYKFKVKKLLNLGSSCIYPKHAPQPLKEEYFLTGLLEPTNEPYAIAKISAIKLCQFYNEQYGTNFISVMPTNLYGPHDNFDLETAHVLPSLMRKFHLASLLEQDNFEAIQSDLDLYPIGKKYIMNISQEKTIDLLAHHGITKTSVSLWGNGSPFREFLYVDDLAQAALFLMQNHDAKAISPFVNIGTGQDIQIKKLATLIKQITQFRGDVTYNTDRPNGTPRKLLNVSKISKLGWQHLTTLELGIKKVYRWYTDEKRNQKNHSFQTATYSNKTAV